MNTQNDTKEIISFYNLENLFPPYKTPNETPSKKNIKNWNTEKYTHKIKQIAQVFTLIKNKYQTLPFLSGICEVEGKKPIQDLLKESPFDENFKFIHIDSPDERGIDVALIYDHTKVEIVHTEIIRFCFKEEKNLIKNNDTTRDILHCEIKYKNFPMHIYILHLPSKREKDINKPKRNYILSELKKNIEKIIQENPHSYLIVMGDFNTNPTDEALNKLLYINNQKILENPFFPLYKKRIFSTFHQHQGLLFDQMIFSENLIKKELCTKLELNQVEVFRPEKLRQEKNSKRPLRTYAGTRYLAGYSDHFPIIAEFKIKNCTL